MADLMVLPETELQAYKALVGKGIHVGESKQCVSLEKDAMQKIGLSDESIQTGNWKGVERKVIDSQTRIPPGTLIATLDRRKYPSKSTGNHAAIYLSSDQTSITVLEQYGSSPGHQIRTIRKKAFDCRLDIDYTLKTNRTKKPSNNADCYYPLIK